jgi:O-antigen ligase
MMEKKKYPIVIWSFFVFATLFPTLRLLFIGNKGSETITEYIFSSLPDLFALLTLSFVFISLIRSRQAIHFKPMDWIVIAFGISNILLGFIVANNLIISAYGFRMTYYPMFFYFIFRFCSSEIINDTLKIIFNWFLIIGIAGIILYVFFYEQMMYMIQLSQEEAATYFVVRMSSVFWTPVVFSVFAASAFLYFSFLYLTKAKWHHLLFMAILAFCILMSISRGTIIATLIAFILLSLLIRNWKRSLHSLLIIITVYFIAAFYIATPSEFFNWLLYSTMDTMSFKKGLTRVDLWTNAIANFREHPLGYGMGKAGHVATRFFSENSTEADVYSTDGWFLKLANETGIWGLLSYLFLAISYFYLYIKNKILLQKANLLVFLFCVFVMVNIQNIVSNVLDFYLFSFLFWTLFGASVKLLYDHQKT